MTTYNYTKKQQERTHIELCKTFDIEPQNLLFEDMQIETIKNGTAPKLYGENNGMFGKQHSRETKTKMSNSSKNLVSVVDENGNNHRVSKDDIRFKSGEFVGIASGKVAVKDSDGNYFLVDKTDPKYLSGELTGVNKGKSWKQKVPSPLKGTFLAKNKDGHKCRLTKNDPRYLSGEYIHFRSKF